MVDNNKRYSKYITIYPCDMQQMSEQDMKNFVLYISKNPTCTMIEAIMNGLKKAYSPETHCVTFSSEDALRLAQKIFAAAKE
jgi:hypothetical protein